MNTIQQHYGRKDIKTYLSKHGETLLPLGDWLVGLELEMEGWSPDNDNHFGGFSFADDGSLRPNAQGNGIEAITKPIAIKYVPSILNAFYKNFKITEANYSERCSTHVHFNVEPLTFQQVSTIALVYQTVERLLFKFVGHERSENIFCVPWNQCNLSYNIVNNIERDGHDVFRRWQKYSALNLIPIVEQGTIEFRHLYGTCDVNLITNWITLLAKLMEYGMKIELDDAKKLILNMNTVSNYHEWLHSVFGEYVGLLQSDGFERELARGVIDSKFMMMSNKKEKNNNELIADILRQNREGALGLNPMPGEVRYENPFNNWVVQAGYPQPVANPLQWNDYAEPQPEVQVDNWPPVRGEGEVYGDYVRRVNALAREREQQIVRNRIAGLNNVGQAPVFAEPPRFARPIRPRPAPRAPANPEGEF